jgi:hypothetical protein
MSGVCTLINALFFRIATVVISGEPLSRKRFDDMLRATLW